MRKSIARIFRAVYETRVYRIYRIDLRKWQPRSPIEDGLDYRFVKPEESTLIAQMESLEEWLEGSIERRLQQGAICLAALENHKVAGFNLVSFGRVWVRLLAIEWSFGHEKAWSEQITVSPDYRGRSIASELRYRIFAELKRRGIARFYGGALAHNKASLKLARKVGFQEIVDVHCRKVLNSRTRRYVRVKHERDEQSSYC